MSKKKKLDIEEYVKKALDNVNTDRAQAGFLLEDIMNVILKNKDLYKDLGPVSAKYIEALTRSNEQLVRIVSLFKPKEGKNEELSDDDKEELFEIFQEERNKEVEKKN